MIVCHCRARRAEDILAAARACGSREPEVVAEAACAGDDCGSCLTRIEALLAAASAASTTVVRAA